jgi:hypothetical protein
MRPSPGVTVLQYFLISAPQDVSSFLKSAANLSRIAFIMSVCAYAMLEMLTLKEEHNFASRRSYVSSVVLSLLERLQADLKLRMMTVSTNVHKSQRTGVSVIAATPNARLMPTCPSNDRGCNETDCAVPPIRRLAPAPTPKEMSPLAPTKRPVSAPGFVALELPRTAHAMTPPAVIPMSRPTRFILPV